MGEPVDPDSTGGRLEETAFFQQRNRRRTSMLDAANRPHVQYPIRGLDSSVLTEYEYSKRQKTEQGGSYNHLRPSMSAMSWQQPDQQPPLAAAWGNEELLQRDQLGIPQRLHAFGSAAGDSASRSALLDSTDFTTATRGGLSEDKDSALLNHRQHQLELARGLDASSSSLDHPVLPGASDLGALRGRLNPLFVQPSLFGAGLDLSLLQPTSLLGNAFSNPEAAALLRQQQMARLSLKQHDSASGFAGTPAASSLGRAPPREDVATTDAKNQKRSSIVNLPGLPGISHQDLYSIRQENTTGDPVDESGQILLYMACDEHTLSDYQCLVRKQIELFEADKSDVASNAQGRNKPIILGQVGIRCRHCSKIPPRHRTRGAIYYPSKTLGLYQAAQNMASAHLCSHCQLIPDALRQELVVLRDRKSSAGGGKRYWSDAVCALGVVEEDNILRLVKKEQPQKDSQQEAEAGDRGEENR